MSVIKLWILNHRVIASGKLTGFMAIEGKRSDGYWF